MTNRRIRVELAIIEILLQLYEKTSLLRSISMVMIDLQAGQLVTPGARSKGAQPRDTIRNVQPEAVGLDRDMVVATL